MIFSTSELKTILQDDGNTESFFRRLYLKVTYNDNYRLKILLRLLRYVEYYEYKKSSSFFNKIIYFLYLLRFRRMRVLTNVIIFPNTLGKGIKFVHPGFRRIDKFVKIGSNCTILPMVLFGRKRPTDTFSDINVGNNCYISTGVTILGPVNIGNNVTIGAGAVVTKDIPDNVVIGGVPAKIIRIKY